MVTSYGVSQIGILKALMSGKSKSDIYDMVKEKKEKLFDKGVKPSQIEKMDKLFDKRFDNAMSDYRYKLKNRPGMKEYRKKQRSAPASDTGSEFSKGGLTGGQKKLDKNKNNRIDAEDFKILRSGRAAMKAKKGKLVPLKKDPTKAISSVKPSAGGKGGPPSKTPKQASKAVQDFMARRKKLGGVKSLIGKGGRIGAAAALLGLAGAGAASLGQKIGRKLSEAKKKNKKMGGGMMNKPMPMYTKGGGADTGTAGERKSQLMTAVDRFKRRIRVRKRRPSYIKPPERKPMIPADVGKVAQSLTPTGLGKQMSKKVMGKMGGGMMMKPMGYKSGTSVKVKCKLGRNKPTKMY